MSLHLSFRKVFNKHSASTNKDTTTSSNITNRVMSTKFTPYPSIRKSCRFKRALKKVAKIIHKSRPRHFIKSIKEVPTYEHVNSTNELSIEETSTSSISELLTSKVESEFYVVKSSKFTSSFKKIGKFLKKSPKILKKSPKLLKNITYIIQNIKFETFIDFVTEVSSYKVHVGPCFNFFTEILSYKSELEIFINSFTEGLSYKGEFDPFINFISELLTSNVEPEAPITKSLRFQRILKKITNFIHKVEREHFNNSFNEVVSYESSISSFEVSSYQEESEPTNEKSSKCISSMKKVRNIIRKNKPEELLEQSQSNTYSHPDEDSPYEHSSSDKEDCPRDKNILLAIDSESTFQSLKKLSKMEKFKRFNFMRKDPVYQITFTVTNKPLSRPENSLAEGPMDISSFENSYQESLICEGNIKFKRNAECVAFKTVQLDGTQTSGSKFNFLKRKFSSSCSFCSSHFSSRSTSSSTIPTTAATSITNGLPTNHVHICKSVLKSKNNINYATEAMMCKLEDGKDTKFFEYFIDKDNVEHDQEHRKPYTRLGRSKQLDNYYELKF